MCDNNFKSSDLSSASAKIQDGIKLTKAALLFKSKFSPLVKRVLSKEATSGWKEYIIGSKYSDVRTPASTNADPVDLAEASYPVQVPFVRRPL